MLTYAGQRVQQEEPHHRWRRCRRGHPQGVRLFDCASLHALLALFTCITSNVYKMKKRFIVGVHVVEGALKT